MRIDEVENVKFRLPFFDESKYDGDAHLKRFGRLAQLHHWDKETWTTRLGSLLQGKALDVYSGLADGEVGSTASLEQGNWGYPAGFSFEEKGARRV